jgi:hypothetical protein
MDKKINLKMRNKYHKLNNFYRERVSRNIGHITFQEQEKFRTTKIAIMGVGGIGGVLAEQLVRIGFNNIIICDNDRYEISNLNRQICTKDDIGKFKVNHLKNYLEKIDSNVEILKFKEITSKNLYTIIKDVKILSLALDDPITSIIIARKCREMRIPMIESWGIPYLWAWWFTSNSIDYETCYGMKTNHLGIKDLEEVNLKSYGELLPNLMRFPGIHEIYNREAGYLEKMMRGEIPYRSFAPFVHLTASYLATEIIFAGLLDVKQKILAPNVVGYDYIRMRPIQFQIK